MSYGVSHLPPPEPMDAGAELASTERYWRDWAAPALQFEQHDHG